MTGDELLENRERERSGLAGPSLGYSEDIAPRKDKRNGLGLNGCGHDIVFCSNRLQDGRAKREIFKRVQVDFPSKLAGTKAGEPLDTCP